MIDVEECYCCGSTSFELVFPQTATDPYLALINDDTSLQRKWMVCRDCGLVFHTPQFEEHETADLYKRYRDESFRDETPDAYFDRISSYPPEKSENHKKVTWLRAVDAIASGTNRAILDVGCGGGLFLNSFISQNPDWQVFGVEPTPNYAELAGRRLNAEVQCGPYRPNLFSRKFDLISMIQVLEHVADPVAFLRQAKADLTDDGLVYLEVPHIYDIRDLPPTHDRFMMVHYWYFSENSLSNVCRKAGFEPVHMERQVSVRNRNNLMIVCRPTADIQPQPYDSNAWSEVMSLQDNG